MAENLADALASSLGGIIGTFVTYPVEIVKNKQASVAAPDTKTDSNGDTKAKERSTQNPSSAMSIARNIHDSRGILGFYEGFTLAAFQNAVEKFIYFYSYSFLRQGLGHLRGGHSMATDLLSGCLAEIAHLPVSVPLETMLIKILTNPGKSLSALVQKTYGENGLSGLYAGTAASAVLSVKPAIQLAVFEAMKARLLAGKAVKNVLPSLSTSQAFFLGAFARAVATLIAFPYIRAKWMLKNMKSADGDGPNSGGILQLIVGMHKALFRLYETSGCAGLYHGLVPEVTRAALSVAVLMAVREKLTVVVKALLLSRRRLKA